jgi:hypothetical protein
MSAKVTKRNVSYKVSIGRQNGFSAYKVVTYSPRYEMWVESNVGCTYWTACEVVKANREAWDTKTQTFEF